LTLCDAVLMVPVARWPTPDKWSGDRRESIDPTAAVRPSGAKKQLTLNDAAATPTKGDAQKVTPFHDAPQPALAYQCQLLAGWSTPRATDGSKGGPNQTGGALPADASLCGTTGATPSASTAETGSGGAYRLNAAFSAWLMGFPPFWDEVACRVQPVTRSRGKAPTAPHGSAGTATRSACKRRRCS
jgi:hypothetical protein